LRWDAHVLNCFIRNCILLNLCCINFILILSIISLLFNLIRLILCLFSIYCNSCIILDCCLSTIFGRCLNIILSRCLSFLNRVFLKLLLLLNSLFRLILCIYVLNCILIFKTKVCTLKLLQMCLIIVVCLIASFVIFRDVFSVWLDLGSLLRLAKLHIFLH
jgi:hypothetical protein